MRRMFFIFLLGLTAGSVYAGTADSLYHPMADAKKDIANAVKQARQEKKYVLVQAGGNWCSWCLEFNRFTTTDKQLDSAIHTNYVVYHLNYSPQNKNFDIFKKYGFPVRFGFPVFLILNGEGELIHTQNSAYLEEGKSYSKKKVMEFLNNWNPAAFDEKNYEWLKKN